MRTLTALALILLLTIPLRAQDAEAGGTVQNLRVHPFYFDALNFAEYGSFGLQGRLDVYVHVPYDIVTFVKDEEFYVGGYDVTVLVMQSEGSKLVKEESWERRIELLTFERTNNPNYYDLTQRSLQLEPGSYLIEVLFEDKESQKEFRLSKTVEVRKFDANLLGISDLMLVRAVESSGTKKQISPQINPNIAALKDGFDLFYEVYNPFQLGGILIDYTITRRGKEVYSKQTTQGIKKGLNTFLASINSSGLGIGSYTIKVKMRRAEDSTDAGVLAQIERQFIVEWLTAGAPISIADLEDAIDQLRYFAKSDELDYIREPQDEDERRRRFEDFWERHNPTPGSKTNAAMIEYYNRVAYSNQHFGHYLAGWKTDRGMVYILYGPPDYIDRHPVDVESKPYEVWEYYDLNKRYVFIDESGFGDYRLLYPLWDDRNRLR
ncbi:MAG: GWxTD domain-containing protein [Bacteroidetes bacterium]|nr:GWxTD domain-containing protein [Bacteroidota bacterium]